MRMKTPLTEPSSRTCKLAVAIDEVGVARRHQGVVGEHDGASSAPGQCSVALSW